MTALFGGFEAGFCGANCLNEVDGWIQDKTSSKARRMSERGLEICDADQECKVEVPSSKRGSWRLIETHLMHRLPLVSGPTGTPGPRGALARACCLGRLGIAAG